MRIIVLFLLVALVAVLSILHAEPVPHCAPSDVALDAATLSNIDAAVEKALTKNLLDGCVICVGRHGKIPFLKAYGDKKTDTVFDIASVTKPVATAMAIMILAQQNKLNIDDPVALYLQEFDIQEKRKVTIRHLLTHVGGILGHCMEDRSDPKKFREYVLATEAGRATLFGLIRNMIFS